MIRWIVTTGFLAALVAVLLFVPAPHTASVLLALLLIGYSASFVYSVWRCARAVAHYEGSRRLAHAKQTWGRLRARSYSFQGDKLYGVYLRESPEEGKYSAVLFPFPIGPAHPLPDEKYVNLMMANLPPRVAPNDWFHVLSAAVAIGLLLAPWATYVPGDSPLLFVPLLLLALGGLTVVCDSAGRKFQQRTLRVSYLGDIKYVVSVLAHYDRGEQDTHIAMITSGNGALPPSLTKQSDTSFTVPSHFTPRSPSLPLPGPFLRRH